MNSNFLIKIGLSEKEAEVYLALLQFGTLSPRDVSKELNINRITAYTTLEGLVKKDYVTVTNDVYKLYTPRPPDLLIKAIERKLDEQTKIDLTIKKLTPKLKNLSKLNKDEVRVRFLEGWEGIKNVFSDIFLAESKDIYAFLSTYSPEAETNEYMQNFFLKLHKKNKKLNAIQPASKIGGGIPSFLQGDRCQVPRNKFDVHSDVYVYGNKIGLISLKENFGSIIEDKDAADVMQEVFCLAREEAARLQNHLGE